MSGYSVKGKASTVAPDVGIIKRLSIAVVDAGEGIGQRTTQTRQNQETTDNDNSFSFLSRAGLPLP